MLFSFSVNAETEKELCPSVKVTIEEDHRMSIQDLDKKTALWAVNNIKEIIEGEFRGLNEYETNMRRWNSEKVLKGYFMLLEAQKEKKGNQLSKGATDKLCQFLQKEAFWYD